ncbi:MAG: MFS transporter, partial [Muribaculaceae bacterium]|nr:MFS transporter [Muribaculaceae bacterium]
MSTATRKPNYTLPIIVMFFLFAMISFVTGFQNPFGVILKAQLGLNNFQSQLGAAANFIAYAIMGIPAGILLQKKGYKFSAISAVLVGLVGVVIMFASSYVESNDACFAVYLIGALVAGFSMCMLNTVVNPMLNTLGGGGNKGNQLIQFGGTLNSLAATICPIFVGILIGNVTKETSLIDARPALYVAGGVFILAFIVLGLAKLPEPILDELKARKAKGDNADKSTPTLSGALGFRHFVLGAVAIFLYIGLEIGIPQISNVLKTAQTVEQAQQTMQRFEAHKAEAANK